MLYKVIGTVLVAAGVVHAAQEHVTRVPISRSRSATNFMVINDNSPAITVTLGTTRDDRERSFSLVSAPPSISFFERIFKYKGTLLLGSLVGVYGALNAYLMWLARAIQSPDSWGFWKHDCIIKDLQEMPQDKLAHELYAALKLKYNAKLEPHILMPFMKFMEDVAREMHECDRFLTIHAWLEKTKLSTVFPAQETHVYKAHEKKLRLIYLNKVLLSWLTEYRVEKVAAV